jgi:septal ring factor EnvC (AmiA/AmiB activator)
MLFNLKQKKNKIFSLIASVVLLVANLSLAQTSNNEVDRLNNEKTERQKKLDQINRQIKEYTQQIADTRNKSNSLKNEIFIYDREIATTELQIQAKETQIEDTNEQIRETQQLIDKKNIEIAENRKILAELIRQLNEYDDDFLIKTTLSSDNLSDFLDQVQYTQSFQTKVYQLVQKIKDLKAKLEQQERELQAQVNKLKELKDELEITQKSLETQRQQKQVLLNQTRGLEQNYQKLLAVSQKEEAQIQKEIENLDSEIRKKLGNKTLSASKGVLAWPIDGILTQKYGNTGFTSLGYTFHNGIEAMDQKGLEDYEMSKVGEAAQFANELATSDALDEEKRMKAFHYHKTLEGMGQIEDLAAEQKSEFVGDPQFWQEEGAEAEHKDMSTEHPGAMAGSAEEAAVNGPAAEAQIPPAKSIHPHRQACKDAAQFFGDRFRLVDRGGGDFFQSLRHDRSMLFVGFTPILRGSRVAEELCGVFAGLSVGVNRLCGRNLSLRCRTVHSGFL